MGSYTDPAYVGLIMDPVADCDLAAFLVAALNNNDKMSLLRSFFGCLAGAVQYLHERQIRHRDIKPPNILVKGDCVYLADFGIALDWSEMARGTTTADTAKSPIYCAPEVAMCEERGSSSDIWSLGCVFVEMISVLKGRSVDDMRTNFKAKSQSHMFHRNIEPCKQWLSDLKLLSARDNPPITWSLTMLALDRAERCTADQLVNTIRLDSTPNLFRVINESFCGDCCLDEEHSQSSGSTGEGEDPWADPEDDNTILISGQPSAKTWAARSFSTTKSQPLNVLSHDSKALGKHGDSSSFQTISGPETQIRNESIDVASESSPSATSHNLPPLKPVFGISLEQLLERDGSPVPTVVHQCIQAVDFFGLDQEGIYRLSGTASHITKIKALLNSSKFKN